MPKITGADRVTRRLTGMAGQQAIQRVGQALFAGGEIIRAEAAHSLTLGAVSGKFHVPSAPGSPPNENTGFLRAGLETIQEAPLRVIVINDIPYAVDLEAGTSKMAARPFMGPAARKSRPEVVALVRRAVDQAIKES